MTAPVGSVKFTDYQRRMWHWLTYFSVCRFYIDRDQEGNFLIKKAGMFRLSIYYGLWINSLVKITYLILTYRGYLMEIHFLDQMSIWDWYLCFSQLVQESNMWCRKYPLFEILHANWKVQEEVFRKLGEPRHVRDRILGNDRGLVIMHMTIIFVGCSSLAIQIFSAPKYALNTYAVVPYDHWLLELFFAAHEVIYIFHIWAHQASSIVLCEVFAFTYTHIIREMTTVLEKLIKQGRPVRKVIMMKVGDGKQASAGKTDSNIVVAKEVVHVHRYLDPATTVTGTEYDIETLLKDYTKLMLATTSFNGWAGKLQGGTTGSNYGQFVSDVFMMIQLLKEPDTDLMAVVFFMEDACAGMVMLFRMLIIISRLYPASEEFLQVFRKYLTHDMPDKKYLRRYQRTMRIIAAKLGGYSTRAITVPKGINALMNYYIAAAMWQKPVDRLT